MLVQYGELSNLSDFLEEPFVRGLEYTLISMMIRKETVYTLVEKVFKENQEQCSKEYIESQFHKIDFLSILDYRRAERMSKAIGVFYHLEKENPSKLLSILIKTDRHVEREYKMSKEFNRGFVVDRFQETLKTASTLATTDTTFQSSESILLALYISSNHNLPMYKFQDILPMQRSLMLNGLYGLIHFYQETEHCIVTLDAEEKKKLFVEYAERIEAYKKAFGIKKSKTYTFGYFMRLFAVATSGQREYPQIPQELAKYFVSDETPLFTDGSALGDYSLNQIENINLSIQSIQTRLYGNHLHDIEEMPIAVEQVDYCILMLFIVAETHRLNWYTSDGLFRGWLKNTILNKDYNALRKHYMESSHTVVSSELSEQLNKERKQKEKVKQELKSVTTKSEGFRLKVNELKEEVRTAQKEVALLKKTVSEVEPHAKELKALRDSVYNASKYHTEEDFEPEPNKVEVLATERVIFVGGHERLVNKLKEVIPKATYISADMHNKNYKHLQKGACTLVLLLASNSHSLTDKVLENAEKNDEANLVIIPNQLGLGRIVDIVYNSVK